MAERRVRRERLASQAARQAHDDLDGLPAGVATRSERGTSGRLARERSIPGNELLWRMRLRRLEAEVVRDAILTVSGDLDQAAGRAAGDDRARGPTAW